MSVTVTDNAITPSTILQTLGDYEVHHSGGPGSAESRAQPTNPRDDLAEAAQAQNPSNWPTDHRGVPAYKPINRSLDQTQRPGGANPVEQAFIFVLLHGVGHLAGISQFWRKTGGKINAKIFYYEIGGEW